MTFWKDDSQMDILNVLRFGCRRFCCRERRIVVPKGADIDLLRSAPADRFERSARGSYVRGSRGSWRDTLCPNRSRISPVLTNIHQQLTFLMAGPAIGEEEVDPTPTGNDGDHSAFGNDASSRITFASMFEQALISFAHSTQHISDRRLRMNPSRVVTTCL